MSKLATHNRASQTRRPRSSISVDEALHFLVGVRHSCMANEQIPSVRVEVSGGGINDIATPAVDSVGQKHRFVGLWVSVIAVVLVVAVVIAVRPSTEPLQDEAVQAETSLPSSPSTGAVAVDVQPPEVQASEGDVESPHRRVNLSVANEFSSVIRLDIGYIAASWNYQGPGSGLYRSVDGVEWAAIDATFPAALDSSLGGSLSFLRRTPTGFAMIAQTYGSSVEMSRRPMLWRLVSADGVNWEVDAEVEAPIGAVYQYPVSNGDSQWAFATQQEAGLPLTELLNRQLLRPLELDVPACWVEPRRVDVLVVGTCDGSEPVELSVEEFIDGTNLTAFAECAAALYGLGTLEIQVLDTASGESTGTFDARESVRFVPGEPSDRAPLVGFDIHPFELDRSGCSSFISLPEDTPSAAVVWEAGADALTRVAVPETLAANGRFGWPAGFVHDDSMVVAAFGQVWLLDLQSYEWTQGPILGTTSSNSYVLTEDGQTLVSIGGPGTLNLTDMVSFETTQIRTGLSNQFQWIQYADEDIALVNTGWSVYRVDLTVG